MITAAMLAKYLLSETAPKSTFVALAEIPEDAPANTISLEAVLADIEMEPERYEEL